MTVQWHKLSTIPHSKIQNALIFKAPYSIVLDIHDEKKNFQSFGYGKIPDHLANISTATPHVDKIQGRQ